MSYGLFPSHMQAANATPSADTPTMTVLTAVARRMEVDVADLEQPLYDAIDPDALDRLLDHGGDVAVTFEYDDHTVSIGGDGTVTVTETDGVGGDEE